MEKKRRLQIKTWSVFVFYDNLSNLLEQRETLVASRELPNVSDGSWLPEKRGNCREVCGKTCHHLREPQKYVLA